MMHQFSNRLAICYGLNEAIVYSHLYDLPEYAARAYERDWILMSWSKLHETFPWWSIPRIKKIVKSLEDQKVIKMRELPKHGPGLYFSFVKEFELV